MGTENDPSPNDCYSRAEPDEPKFTLLARDPHAAAAVEKWADDREFFIECGEKPEGDRASVAEARDCAQAMRAWRAAHRPPSRLDLRGPRRGFPAWADDELGWNQETGAPSKRLVGNAIQVWAMLRNRTRVSVAEAALAFNLPPARVVDAVEDHAWMYLSGPTDDYSKLLIEHDGE